MKKESVEKPVPATQKRGGHFAKSLLNWNQSENLRQMPWKGEKDPYKIWLSEVMLQQTRVEQGLKYYQKFIEAFPTVHSLAAAPETRVFKLWEGLGYYSRCRNLIATAQYISTELGGIFPKQYEDILALKGIGNYTAAAIASFAYNLPYAVLDGNVFRVLSRIFDIELPIDSTVGKKAFSNLAQSILPVQQAGEYNQAIMDFGALICKPSPVCDVCFFQRECTAYLSGKQDLLPIKEKKTAIKKRWFNYFIVQCGDEVLLQQRKGKDVWQDLYQFVLIETPKACKKNELEALLQSQFGLHNYSRLQDWKEEQQLSHQTIFFHFILVQLKQKEKVENYQWTSFSASKELAFPRTLQQVVASKLNV